MRFGIFAWPCSEDIWRQVAPLLQRSIERTDDEEMRDALAALDRGTAHLWIAEDDGGIAMALLTLIVKTRDGLALEYWHIGGKRPDQWFGMMTETVEAAARQAGLVKVLGGGRPGWQRLAKGYRTTGIRIEKRL